MIRCASCLANDCLVTMLLVFPLFTTCALSALISWILFVILVLGIFVFVSYPLMAMILITQILTPIPSFHSHVPLVLP